MTGIYYLPLPTLCYEVGITRKRARAALEVLAREGFAEYDEETSVVWVPEMARCQVGNDPKPDDKRIKGFLRELAAVPHPVFVGKFIEKYRKPFQLDEESLRKVIQVTSANLETPREGHPEDIRRGIEGAPEGHRSPEPLPEPAPEPAPEPRETAHGAARDAQTEHEGPVEGVSPEELVLAWNANRGGMAEARPIDPERRKLLQAFLRKRPKLTVSEFGSVVKALGTDPWACGATERRRTRVTIKFLLRGSAFEDQREMLLAGPRRVVPRAGPHAAANTLGRYDDVPSVEVKT
jgi:hypothetical protein